MSTTETAMPGDSQTKPGRSKRSRFAGERLGAWVFAASFSIGIWGLALKILSPAHPTPVVAPTPHYAALAPSGAPDGRAAVVWESDAADLATGYPATDGVPVTALNSSDYRDPHPN